MRSVSEIVHQALKVMTAMRSEQCDHRIDAITPRQLLGSAGMGDPEGEDAAPRDLDRDSTNTGRRCFTPHLPVPPGPLCFALHV